MTESKKLRKILRNEPRLLEAMYLIFNRPEVGTEIDLPARIADALSEDEESSQIGTLPFELKRLIRARNHYGVIMLALRDSRSGAFTDRRTATKEEVLHAIAVDGGHPDASVRRYAVQAITLLETEAASLEPMLVNMLMNDECLGVKAMAALGLVKIDARSCEALSALQASMKSEVHDIRMNSLLAIGNMEATASSVLPLVIEAVNDPDSEVRWVAVGAISKIGASADIALPVLKEALKDADSRVVTAAADGIGKLAVDSADAFCVALEMLRESGAMGELFLSLLERYTPILEPSTTEKLLYASRHSNPRVRIAGYENLARTKRTFHYLVPALTDEDPRIRSVAAKIFVKMRSHSIIALEALKNVAAFDSDSRVRVAAVTAIGAIGPRALSALPTLQLIENDQDEELRDAIKRAKQAINIFDEAPKECGHQDS